ncbi:hypothetical protein Landi51_01652 [Colletotrichum acutatum]
MPTLDGCQLLRFYSLFESETSRAQHTRSNGGDREQPEKVPFLKYPSTLVFLHGAIVAYQRLGLHFTHFPLEEHHPSFLPLWKSHHPKDAPVEPAMSHGPPVTHARNLGIRPFPSRTVHDRPLLFHLHLHPPAVGSIIPDEKKTDTHARYRVQLDAASASYTTEEFPSGKQALCSTTSPSSSSFSPIAVPPIADYYIVGPPETHLPLGHLDPPRASRHQHNFPSSQPT